MRTVTRNGGAKRYIPVRGVFCINSLVPTSVPSVTLIIPGLKTMLTTIISVPVRRKMPSKTRNAMRILFAMAVVL